MLVAIIPVLVRWFLIGFLGDNSPKIARPKDESLEAARVLKPQKKGLLVLNFDLVLKGFWILFWWHYCDLLNKFLLMKKSILQDLGWMVYWFLDGEFSLYQRVARFCRHGDSRILWWPFHMACRPVSDTPVSQSFQHLLDVLLMVQKSGDHHLGCIKLCKWWDKTANLNWWVCRISSTNRITQLNSNKAITRRHHKE